MLTKDEILEKLKALMPELRREYGVGQIGLFGSFARDEGTQDSDIDLLVIYENRPKGLDYFSLGIYLEEVFGRKVDLGEPHYLKSRIKDNVLEQVKYI